MERMAVAADEDLLSLDAAQEALKQPRRIRIRRTAENPRGRGDQRRAFRRVDKLDRLSLLLELQQDRVRAIGLHGALAEPELFGGIARRLHLHHSLLRQLLEERPAEFAHECERRGENRAAIARMRFDDPALPFGIEQIGKAARRVLGLDQISVVPEAAERRAHGRVHAVRVHAVCRIMLRHILGEERRKPAAALP
jgi:hypothetical protein